MPRLHTTATAVNPELAPLADEWTPGRVVGGAVVLALGAFLFVVVGGAVIYAAITGGLDWDALRWLVLIGALPATIPAVLLALAVWKWSVMGLELLTGRDLDGDGAVGDGRLIVVNKPARKTLEGVDEGDLIDFIRVIYQTRDWTQRVWSGRVLTSGRRCDNVYHESMMRLLTRAGIVADYGPRRKGRLSVASVDEALGLLKLM